VGVPPDLLAGNRRGSFAATPEGHRGASGAAPSADNSVAGAAKGSGSGNKTQGNIPPGLYVGKAAASISPVAGDSAAKNSSAYSVNPNLIANARPPRLTARSLQSEGDSQLSQEERGVFGNRKFYSLSLNMPNLNSAGGSWIIRFSPLRSDLDSGGPPSRSSSLSGASAGELSAPTATVKVDPAYPLELMRQNLGGTVILYAIIHADGAVSGVRVLRSVDERLDRYASNAIAKWKFDPATKNGIPVEVEATFWIPFRPTKAISNF
jgi:TonB family protein